MTDFTPEMKQRAARLYFDYEALIEDLYYEKVLWPLTMEFGLDDDEADELMEGSI